MIIVSIISTGLLIVAIGIDTDNSALAKKYKKTQTLAHLITVETNYCQQI